MLQTWTSPAGAAIVAACTTTTTTTTTTPPPPAHAGAAAGPRLVEVEAQAGGEQRGLVCRGLAAGGGEGKHVLERQLVLAEHPERDAPVGRHADKAERLGRLRLAPLQAPDWAPAWAWPRQHRRCACAVACPALTEAADQRAAASVSGKWPERGAPSSSCGGPFFAAITLKSDAEPACAAGCAERRQAARQGGQGTCAGRRPAWSCTGARCPSRARQTRARCRCSSPRPAGCCAEGASPAPWPLRGRACASAPWPTHAGQAPCALWQSQARLAARRLHVVWQGRAGQGWAGQPWSRGHSCRQGTCIEAQAAAAART